MESDLRRVRFNVRMGDALRKAGWEPVDVCIGGQYIIVRWRTMTEASNVALRLGHECVYDVELGWYTFCQIPS